jgi:hypothetical protein
VFRLALDPKIHSLKCYIFLPIACTSTQDIDLVRDDFLEFYNLMYYNVTLLEHAITRFLDLLNFLGS